MPRYITAVEVPASTPEDNAITSTVTVEQAVIVEAFIFIDGGAKDRVRGEVRFGDRRVHPHPNSSPQRIPNVVNPASVNIQLPGVPNELRLRAWAPNANNPHDVVAVLDMQDPDNVAQDVTIVGAEDIGGATARPGRGSAEDLTD